MRCTYTVPTGFAAANCVATTRAMARPASRLVRELRASNASCPRLPPDQDNENGSPGNAVASIAAPPARPAMRQVGLVSADRIQSSPPRCQRRLAANNRPSLQITIQHRYRFTRTPAAVAVALNRPEPPPRIALPRGAL